MIYWELFLTFLKIGAVSFGGGYGMISLIRDDCFSKGWLTDGELLNFIAVSESTPGPIAVNMATFVGSSQGGILGALFSTIGVVLPSFIIILLVATILSMTLKYAGVKVTLRSIRPAIIGMILATAFTMLLSLAFSIKTITASSFQFNWKPLAILGIVIIISFSHFRIRKKPINPILLILISGTLGIFFF